MIDIKKQYAIALVILLAIVFYLGLRYGEAGAARKQPPAAVQQNIIGVHIKGAVEYPGYYELPAASRLHDLLELAAPRQEARLEDVNLAAFLIDGEEIFISAQAFPSAQESAASAAETQAAASYAAPQGDKININSAGIEELTRLNGIGEVKAEAIINYRESHGPFKKLADIKKVSGIGDATYEKIKDEICLE